MTTKTQFPITDANDKPVGTISIIGEKIISKRKEDSEEVYIRIDMGKNKYWMRTEDLELFGVSILKAIKSKKLKV